MAYPSVSMPQKSSPVTRPMPRFPQPSATALEQDAEGDDGLNTGTADAIIFPFSAPFSNLHRREGRALIGGGFGGAAASMGGDISLSSTASAGVAAATVDGNIAVISVPGATSGTCSAGWNDCIVLQHEHLPMAMMRGGTTPEPKTRQRKNRWRACWSRGIGGLDGWIDVLPARPR